MQCKVEKRERLRKRKRGRTRKKKAQWMKNFHLGRGSGRCGESETREKRRSPPPPYMHTCVGERRREDCAKGENSRRKN